MPHKKQTVASDQQLSLDFDAIIEHSEVRSRDEIEKEADEQTKISDYDPVSQTADYARKSLKFEEAWETSIHKAREQLLQVDPRELYLSFFRDLKNLIEQNVPKASVLAGLLEQVGIRGLGMTPQQIDVRKPLKGGTRWRVQLEENTIQAHLEKHIVGKYFLNPITIDKTVWNGKDPLVGASDVSQHLSAVPVPARFFKRSVPFVLNNAAGTLFRIQDNRPRYENIFNPKPDESLIRWMLIDPSYQDELEPEDYQRCLASAMDVGQYKFDREYLLKTDRQTPALIFRDGSLFPQDAYIDNYIIPNKRGEFTREAIREMLDCLSYAKALNVVYCGVSKNVQLKVYSAVIDWFIAKYIDNSWELGSYTLNDGQAMSMLLATPSFVENNLQKSVYTCLIRRSFTTRANLNTKANLLDLDTYFKLHHYEDQSQEFDIRPYKKLCEIAHLYMFFIGHSKTPQQQLPRYEFFYDDSVPIPIFIQKILSALQYCSVMSDHDHSFMADEPITYLIPSVTQQAHLLSKDVGKLIDKATGQRIMAQYRMMLSKISGGHS